MTKVEFWSDHIAAPKTIFRNLSDETIKQRMVKALDLHQGDGDLWACRTTIDRNQWTENMFCFTKVNGVITQDHNA